MKSKSDKFVQLMLSCVKQRWSLSKYEQNLKRYYAEEYYVHEGRYYLGREQIEKGASSMPCRAGYGTMLMMKDGDANKSGRPDAKR